ncbi:uncharacterized protein [Anabrus simplex]|uniref:uncharacterized protein n=1 Tax=Anabrus simplex TaxID=316456 RepID=UPI0035A386F9
MKYSTIALAAVLLVALLAQKGTALRKARQENFWWWWRTTTTSTTTTARPQVQEQVDSNGSPVNCNCLTTPEYNPVCGTNGLTYGSKSKLECGKRCGHNVELSYYGNCT